MVSYGKLQLDKHDRPLPTSLLATSTTTMDSPHALYLRRKGRIKASAIDYTISLKHASLTTFSLRDMHPTNRHSVRGSGHPKS
jgi:hypothetical protein